MLTLKVSAKSGCSCCSQLLPCGCKRRSSEETLVVNEVKIFCVFTLILGESVLPVIHDFKEISPANKIDKTGKLCYIYNLLLKIEKYKL